MRELNSIDKRDSVKMEGALKSSEKKLAKSQTGQRGKHKTLHLPDFFPDHE